MRIDYVLCLDSDHVYTVEDLYMLINRMKHDDLKLLSGAYYARGERRLAHGQYLNDGKFERMLMDGLSGVVECDVIGMGFCVLRKDLLDFMFKKYGKTLFQDTFIDDVCFCEKVKKENIRIRFDADVIIGHLSTMINK